MSVDNWRKATRRLSRQGPPEAEIVSASAALTAFLGGRDGAAARDLLSAARMYIPLAAMDAGGSSTVRYFLDGQGLYKVTAVEGMSAVYSHDEPKRAETTACAVVNAFFDQHGSTDIVQFIQRKLDAIADEVLRR